MKKILILNLAVFLMMASGEVIAKSCEYNEDCDSYCCLRGECQSTGDNCQGVDLKTQDAKEKKSSEKMDDMRTKNESH